MIAGMLTAACLVLGSGAGADDTVYLNQLAIKIPFDIKPADRQQISELHLYRSTDEGKTWNQEAILKPDQDGYKFTAPKDGLYWFTVDVVDLKGIHNPKDMAQAKPAQKIVIDTLKPLIRFVSAERKGDDVTVAWEIQEDHPDLASLKLEYRTADAPPSAWYAVPVEPALMGRKSFRVSGPGAVSVRMQMQDLAQNQATEQAEVHVSAGTSAAVGRGSESPTQLPATSPSPGGEMVAKPHEDTSFTPVGSDSQPSGIGPAGEGIRRVAADSVKNATTGAGGLKASGRGLPPVKVVKSKEVTLEYALGKVGPSGIGAVQLWLTDNNGDSWRLYAEDPDPKPPLQNGKCQRTVELPGEGVFGISLVVRSRAGLGKPPPKRGDLPQMRIEVDLTPPVVKLDEPKPDPNRRDALVITWTATDPDHPDLAANPITLQWAERKGDWKTIAARLPNTGKYVWQLPADIPVHVYLRLVARDAAGNEGVFETAEPQLVDLSEPEGMLLGVVNPDGQP
jgi:hypothetical protein